MFDCPETPSLAQSRADIISRSQTRISTDIHSASHIEMQLASTPSLTLPAHASHIHILPPTPPPSPPPVHRLPRVLPKIPALRRATGIQNSSNTGWVLTGRGDVSGSAGRPRGDWPLGWWKGREEGRGQRESVLPLAGQGSGGVGDEPLEVMVEGEGRPLFGPTAWERVMGI